MFPRFSGVPQSVIRLGILKELSGSAVKVYIALLYESERCCNRELIRTVAELQKLAGGSRNAHAKARAQLVRTNLVRAEYYGVEGFIFLLCDPETGQPWPGHPQEQIKYGRKDAPVTDPATAIEVKMRKPPKIANAGVEFPFGANAVEHPGRGRKAIEPISQASRPSLRWEEVGNGTNLSKPPRQRGV